MLAVDVTTQQTNAQGLSSCVTIACHTGVGSSRGRVHGRLYSSVRSQSTDPRLYACEQEGAPRNVVFMDNDILVFKSIARIFETEDFDYGCTISDSPIMPVRCLTPNPCRLSALATHLATGAPAQHLLLSVGVAS